MNKKLIFRIFGAISSALIVVSVFLPYVSVSGYSESLWGIYKVVDTLYLPIMIIVFGIIGVVFFALNVKTEFAYATSGAILFFGIMQTFEAINQEAFNTLGVGYYFLVAGSVLTGVMAFLSDLGEKKSKDSPIIVENNTPQITTLNQIDKLYDEQNKIDEGIPSIQPIDNTISTIPVNPIPEQTISPIPEFGTIQEQQIPETNSIPVQSIPQQNVIQEQVIEPVPEIQSTIPDITEKSIQPQINVQQQVNPVVEQFTEQRVNPVVQEFMSNNPPVSQIDTNISNVQPVLDQNQNSVPLNSINEPVKINPVVQEFTNPEQGLQFNQNINTNETDIFGQPVNK